MKKNRIAALVLAGVLSVSLLGGCMDDDWEDETEYEEELNDEEYDEEDDEDSEDGDDEGSEDSDLQAYGEAGVVDDNLEYGSGAALCDAEGALDDNPTRAVRRSTTPINQTVNTMLEDFYMYRNMFSPQYQKAYDQICAGLMNCETPIVMSVAVPKEDINNVYFSVINDHPELFWVGVNMSYRYNNNGLVTEVTPEYYQGSPSQYNAEVAANVDQALADMWALGSDIDKVKYAHDYLTNTIDYTHNDLDQSAYSGFVWKQTVCAGYAKCFAYMMHKMGIPCVVLLGYAGEAHAWNQLYLDGDYYVMDVTWDDPIGNPANTYYYNYFNITEGEISKNHTRGRENITIFTSLPMANGTAYSFQNYYGGAAYGTNFDAVNGQMPEQTSYDDYDDYDDQGYYEYSDYDEEDSGWWNTLDSSWTQDDWTYDEEGYWYIYDEDTGYYYLYVEEDESFGAMTEDQETIYWLDNETGEWVEQ